MCDGNAFSRREKCLATNIGIMLKPIDEKFGSANSPKDNRTS
jgi:hypothetical protein